MAAIVITFGLYLIALFGVAVAAFTHGRGAAPPAGVALIYLWVFDLVFQAAIPDQAMVLIALLDLATAAGFLWFARERGAAVFAATLAAQAMLIGFQLLDPLEPYTFWRIHTASAFAQLAILLAWVGFQQRKDDPDEDRA